MYYPEKVYVQIEKLDVYPNEMGVIVKDVFMNNYYGEKEEKLTFRIF